MRQSELFTKTRKEAPKDEVAKNAKLLIRGAFIHKEMAGVYALLPLGLRVFKKIENIIREEMNAIGGQEVNLTTLQDPGIWKRSGRWDDTMVDNWFKTHLHDGEKYHQGPELGIANTHEEPLTRILSEYVDSYRDLPRYVYQFQNKFRNELRAKSGIMRAREFVMKDLYSFNVDEKESRAFYEQCAKSYEKIFSRVGIGKITYRTFASGGSFSRYSDEYQTLSDAGEDTIYVHEKQGIAVNKEVYTDEVLADLGMKKDDLVEKKAIEVGNIFPLGTRFSRALNLTYKDEKGEKHPVIMGSYGIGLGRLMGVVAEVLSDEKGLVWPKSIAPFRIHLLALASESPKVVKAADALYKRLTKAGVEVLYDDRNVRAGEKFADAELLGIPYRVVMSEKTLAKKKIELTARTGAKSTLVAEAKLLNL